MGRSAARRTSPNPVLFGSLFGALIVLALVAVYAWPISGPGSKEQVRKVAFEAPIGSCVSWHRSPNVDMATVPCAAQHMFEIVGKVNITPAPGGALPATAQLKQLGAQQCTDEAKSYLGGKLDPQGRYAVGVFPPDAQQWQDGDHTMDCELRAASKTGMLSPTTGSARGQDQSAVHPVGTCFALTPTGTEGDPAPCTQSHASQIVGTVNLRAVFGNDYPSEDKQQHELVSQCQDVSKKYLGSHDLKTLHLTLTWDTLSKDSWAAGSYQVNCKALAPKKGGGLSPISGSLGAQ